MENPLLREFLMSRAKLHKKPPAEKKKGKAKGGEIDNITLATIIEDKPKDSEVVKYFRARADELDGSNQ
jgi:hypothetical protein